MFRIQVGHGNAMDQVLVKVGAALVGVLFVPGTAVIAVGGEGKSQVEEEEGEKRDSFFHFHHGPG